MIYFRLFFNFFTTGLFAVGGGLATLPFLSDMAERTGWFTYHQLMDILAISESTPGAIGVNMSTYVGFITGGHPLLGALAGTAGLVAPSIIIILIVAKILEKFRNSPYVQYAFHGLKPASIGLIAAAGWSVFKIVALHTDMLGRGSLIDLFNMKSIILGVIIFLLMMKFKKIHPAAFIGISAVVGIVFSFAQ